MIFTAHLLAFDYDAKTREIDVPDSIIDQQIGSLDQPLRPGKLVALLEQIFFYGQNDFQPRPIRSLSVGDVVRLHDGRLYRVLGLGWERIPEHLEVEDLARGMQATLARPTYERVV